MARHVFSRNIWLLAACFVTRVATADPAHSAPVVADPLVWRGNQSLGQIFSIAFSSDGCFVATGSRVRSSEHAPPANNLSKVTLWDLKSKKVLKTFKHGWTRSPAQVSVLFSPDGRLLASSSEGSVVVWDVATGAEKRRLESGDSGVRPVAFSAANATLETATLSGTNYQWSSRSLVWDLKTGNILSSQQRNIKRDVYSPDRQVFANIPAGDVVVYDAASRKMMRTLERPNRTPDRVAFSLDSKLLAASRSDGVVRRGREVRGANGAVFHIATEDDNDNEETMWIWDVATGRLLQSLSQHTWGVNAIAFSPDGSYLASASDDGTLRLWPVRSTATTRLGQR